MSALPPFETVPCPYCQTTVIPVYPAERGWPRTAFTHCPSCRRTLVVERMATGSFRVRRHRGIFEGKLRL